LGEITQNHDQEVKVLNFLKDYSQLLNQDLCFSETDSLIQIDFYSFKSHKIYHHLFSFNNQAFNFDLKILSTIMTIQVSLIYILMESEFNFTP